MLKTGKDFLYMSHSVMLKTILRKEGTSTQGIIRVYVI